MEIEEKKKGREVKGMERIEEKFEEMKSMKIDFNIRNIIEKVDLGEKIEDQMEKEIKIYMKGDVGMIENEMRKIVKEEI